MEAKKKIKEIYTEINAASITEPKDGIYEYHSNTHYVYIVDVNGIPDVFSELKSKLLDNPTKFQTLIYVINQNEKLPLFKAELTSLDKRFSHQLEIHYIYNEAMPSLKMALQETLEIVINTKLNNDIFFQISGNEMFENLVLERLYFLGIKKNQIGIQ